MDPMLDSLYEWSETITGGSESNSLHYFAMFQTPDPLDDEDFGDVAGGSIESEQIEVDNLLTDLTLEVEKPDQKMDYDALVIPLTGNFKISLINALQNIKL